MPKKHDGPHYGYVAYMILSKIYETKPIKLGEATRRHLGNVAKEMSVEADALYALMAQFAFGKVIESSSNFMDRTRTWRGGSALRHPQRRIVPINTEQQHFLSLRYLQYLLMDEGVVLGRGGLYQQAMSAASSLHNVSKDDVQEVLTALYRQGIRETFGADQSAGEETDQEPSLSLGCAPIR